MDVRNGGAGESPSNRPGGGQIGLVAEILSEAAIWLAGAGKAMWDPAAFTPDALENDVGGGLFLLARVDGEAAGVLRLQTEDPEFWPEAMDSESLFLHKLAIRRKFSGSGAADALVQSAVSDARGRGLRYVRLDCADDRPKLAAFYERLGFSLSDRVQAGRFSVARYEMDLGARDED